MKLEVNKIITLGNNEEYLIIDKIEKDGEEYYYIAEVNEEGTEQYSQGISVMIILYRIGFLISEKDSKENFKRNFLLKKAGMLTK